MAKVTIKYSLFICVLLLLLSETAQAQFVQPTTGPVSSHIKERWGRPHKGIDIVPPDGTPSSQAVPVVAAYEGRVVYKENPGGYGSYLYIEHPNGLTTLYGHLRERTVPDGSYVQTGQTIGDMGGDRPEDGRSTGRHLHFEITNGFLGSVYAPDGEHWDEAAGLQEGQVVSAGSPINISAAGLPETEGVQGQGGGGAEEEGGFSFRGAGKRLLDGAVKLGQKTNILPEVTAYDLPEVEDRFDLSNIDIDNSSGQQAFLPTPKEWIDATMNAMDDLNLAKNINTVGMTLLFAFFVWSLINITYYYQSDQYLALFGRLIVASGLIFAAPAISGETLRLWEGVYDSMSQNVVKPATDDLEAQLDTLGPALAAAATATVAIKIAGGLVPDVVPGNDLIDEASALSGGFTKGIYGVMILMGSLYGIYLLVIYSSAITVILAGVILPVVAAFLMLPGSSSWINRWLSMVLLAFANIVAFPFVYSVVVTVGVEKPMSTTNEIVQDMLAQFEGVKNVATDASLFYMANLGTTIPPALFNIQKLMIQWLFSLIFLAIAVLASIYIMKQLPGLLQGFLGGVSGSVANAVSGSALGGIAAAGAGVAAGAGTAGGNAAIGGGKALAGGARAFSGRYNQSMNDPNKTKRRKAKIEETKPEMKALEEEIKRKNPN